MGLGALPGSDSNVEWSLSGWLAGGLMCVALGYNACVVCVALTLSLPSIMQSRMPLPPTSSVLLVFHGSTCCSLLGPRCDADEDPCCFVVEHNTVEAEEGRRRIATVGVHVARQETASECKDKNEDDLVREYCVCWDGWIRWWYYYYGRDHQQRMLGAWMNGNTPCSSLLGYTSLSTY